MLNSKRLTLYYICKNIEIMLPLTAIYILFTFINIMWKKSLQRQKGSTNLYTVPILSIPSYIINVILIKKKYITY